MEKQEIIFVDKGVYGFLWENAIKIPSKTQPSA
jgi:hypothetical protein